MLRPRWLPGPAPAARFGRPLLSLVVAAGLLASACGAGSGDQQASEPSAGAGQPDEVVAGTTDFSQSSGVVVANTPGTVTTVGRQRLMTAILGQDDQPFLGGPDDAITIGYREIDGDADLAEPGTWLTTNASELGLYVTTVDFPTAGQWEVIVTAGNVEVGRTSLTVTDDSPVPGIGDAAPATDSPTATDPAEITTISTDPDPDPAFYALSIAEAIGNGRPTMIAFVTPGFCQTALCGPTLEAVKGASAGLEGLDVVHVEPFDIESARAGDLRPIPAMAEWGLQTEPWVFVIDADGAVQSSFEGIIGQHELEAAVDRLRATGDLAG